MPQVSFSSLVGDLTLNEEDGFLTSLQWKNSETQNPTKLLTAAQTQVLAYFAGELEVFDLPLAPAGTGFQKRVWLEMQKIPYGQVKTYGALAGQVKSGLSSAARAVGTACGANPIPIIIPCHRVIAAQGLGGYSGAGGLATKQTLLAHEGRQLQLV